MIRAILQRLIQSATVLLGVTVVTFLLMHLAPGNPLQANPEFRHDPTAVERWLQQRQLDRPLPAQYLSWLSRLWRGDFGVSLLHNRPVVQLVAERLPATIALGGTSFVLALLLALPLGALSAARSGSRLDRALNLFSLACLSVPSFWSGMLLMLLFTYLLPWLPAAGMRSPGDGAIPDIMLHLILPVLTLASAIFAGYFRFVRSCVQQVLVQDYVRTAKAKGLSEPLIFWRHVAPNAALPLITMAALSLPFMFTGAMMVETVFAWPGIGRFVVNSALARDYPVIMFVNMYAAAVVAAANLLAELLYLAVNPRVRM